MSLEVLDWRRRIGRLYEQVRAEPIPAQAHSHWIKTRDELFASHPASPLLSLDRPLFKAARYGPYEPSLRFEVEIDTEQEALDYVTQTGTDGTVRFTRIGKVHLEELGSLDVWWLNSYGGGLFIPFVDADPETYGGGRYVIDTVKGADLGGSFDALSGSGQILIDLNFAYNPSCAYDPAWACPLAPEGNRLTQAVHVGELSTWDHL